MCTRYMTHKGVALLQMRNIPVNSLSVDLRRSLLENVQRARKEKMEALVIFGEGKGFSAGADFAEFARRKHLESPMLREIVDVLEDSAIPVVAGIHGYCLGGALALALGCHYRIADRSAKIGFPEVNIGLIPGSGATQRLPRIVGPEMALDLCISGENVPVQEAFESKLVDKILLHDLSKLISAQDSDLAANFAVQELTDFALEKAADGADALKKRNMRHLSHEDIPGDTSDDFWLDYHAKHIEGAKVRYRAQRGTKAPAAAFRAVQVACKVPSFDTGLQMEKRAFDELAADVEARSLQYASFGDQRLRKLLEAVRVLNDLKSDGQDPVNVKGAIKVAGVEQDTVIKARALWSVADSVFRRYVQELSLLLESGRASGAQVEEALLDIVGMTHRPSELVEALGMEKSSRGSENGDSLPPLGTADIVSRCLFPAVNEGIDAILLSIEGNKSNREVIVVQPDELDAVFRHAHLVPSSKSPTFPRFRGGPMFYAETDLGLRDVMGTLKTLHEADQSRTPSLAPSSLLVDTVQACSALKEEIYFRLQ